MVVFAFLQFRFQQLLNQLLLCFFCHVLHRTRIDHLLRRVDGSHNRWRIPRLYRKLLLQLAQARFPF